MIKEFIGTGKTVEEATQNAKLQLNAPEMADVHVEVRIRTCDQLIKSQLLYQLS